ncbi:hypothetical protein GB937_004550 [Aspergillus fischeri]|nr:hypothetical protein GB937_004550 [Aspergillus fischeri]
MSIELNPAAKKGRSRGGNGPVLHYILACRSTTGDENTGGLHQKRQLASHGSAILLSIVDGDRRAQFHVDFSTRRPRHGNTPSETCQGESKSVRR